MAEILYDNLNDEGYRESYNDLENEKNHLSYEEWFAQEKEWELKDLLEEFTWSEFNSYCILSGTCGLWDGNHEIVPVRCQSLKEAFLKTLLNSPSHITVSLVDGSIQIRIIHHDGTNNFTINALNDKGADLFNDTDVDLTDNQFHSYIS